MENMNGINGNNWSDEYRILVRFFKECGLFEEFKEYQKIQTNPICQSSNDIVTEFSHAEFTMFLLRHYGNFPKYHLFTTFIKFLFIFYPSQLEKTKFPRVKRFLNDCLSYPIDKEKRTINTEFNKKLS